MKRILIGITGGIGSGKSEVSAYLRQRSEQVICADEAAREVVQKGENGSDALRIAFGSAYFLPDGSLNRIKLAQRVFEQPEDLKQLNGLLHPLIIQSIWDKALKLEGRVFIDAALLIETEMHIKMDYVWVVTAEMETRICRVMKRDGVAREAVEKRIINQMDDAQRLKFADEIIDNSSSLEALYRQIDYLLKRDKYNEVNG
jgi:dephospho-CoA kinase